jgi:type I restriction enzyme M protein
MEHDGFSLDDKRQRVPENDIPDVLQCWRNRNEKAFLATRESRLTELKNSIAPLVVDRLKRQEAIHRLKFEEVISDEPEKARAARERAEAELSVLQLRIAPPQREINQLGRQFSVEKKRVVANKYDLTASRYREVEHEDVFLEKPAVTLERLHQLEAAAAQEATALEKMLSES